MQNDVRCKKLVGCEPHYKQLIENKKIKSVILSENNLLVIEFK